VFGQSGNSKKKDDGDAVQKKSIRGNMDEYEALRTIVSENPGLLTRVLEKIRVARTMNNTEKQNLGKAQDKKEDDKKDKK
jgi:hypothetical protein